MFRCFFSCPSFFPIVTIGFLLFPFLFFFRIPYFSLSLGSKTEGGERRKGGVHDDRIEIYMIR